MIGLDPRIKLAEGTAACASCGLLSCFLLLSAKGLEPGHCCLRLYYFIFYCFSNTERSYTHKRKQKRKKKQNKTSSAPSVTFLWHIHSLILSLTCKHRLFLPFFSTLLHLHSYPRVNCSILISSHPSSALFHLFIIDFFTSCQQIFQLSICPFLTQYLWWCYQSTVLYKT